MRESLSIERVSPDDLMSLVGGERGAAPLQIGAVLFLDTRSGLEPERAVEQLGQRIRSVPRLRQRLLTVPFGCGRPVWWEDTTFELSHHVTTVHCPAPGGEQAVRDLAAALLVAPLPRDRPLWAARLVTDVAEHEAALILVFHHVLADGLGGLAVLASLFDGAPMAAARAVSLQSPSVPRLIVDAWSERLHAIERLPAGLRRLGAAAFELRTATHARLAPTSLNRPTGARRRLASVRVDLCRVRALGHAHHATVNDVLLTVIGGALHRLLALRGEQQDRFVISVPFSARRQTTAGELGNQSGVIPLAVPGVGEPLARLLAVATTTRAAKLTPPGASTALLGPLFRALARLGLYQRFIDSQRMIHTFVSNLHGPAESQAIFACPIRAIEPMSVAPGNVTVSFLALSYAGVLTIEIIVDPATCPDLSALQQAITDELDALLGGTLDARTPESAWRGQ